MVRCGATSLVTYDMYLPQTLHVHLEMVHYKELVSRMFPLIVSRSWNDFVIFLVIILQNEELSQLPV